MGKVWDCRFTLNELSLTLFCNLISCTHCSNDSLLQFTLTNDLYSLLQNYTI